MCSEGEDDPKHNDKEAWWAPWQLDELAFGGRKRLKIIKKKKVISNQNHRKWVYDFVCQVTTVFTSGNYSRDRVLN